MIIGLAIVVGIPLTRFMKFEINKVFLTQILIMVGYVVVVFVNHFINDCIRQFKLHQQLLIYEFNKAREEGKKTHFTQENAIRDIRFRMSETWCFVGAYLATIFNVFILPNNATFADIIIVYSVVIFTIVSEVHYGEKTKTGQFLADRFRLLLLLSLKRDNTIILTTTFLTLIYLVGLVNGFNFVGYVWELLVL